MEFIEIIEILIKLGVGLSILKVWLLNRNKNTPWRGASASSMEEEFAAYGLSKNVMIIVGTLKSIFALLLISSIGFPAIEYIGAVGIATLMAGAIFMHFKIKDPIKKSFPAALFLVLSISTLFIGQ
ncbi:DoxX family protein [Nonlabens sp.]|uniref:DoxX family protein n=1 Tax=Nonlabens sp. TaxID=1888209 RepID=UPI001BCC6CC7|nr:DoxX family protein [Nonlabens sp.]